MEASPNQNLLPLKGTVEAETKRRAKVAQDIRAVISGISSPDMVRPYVSVFDEPIIPVTERGWDSEGNYHERPEVWFKTEPY